MESSVRLHKACDACRFRKTRCDRAERGARESCTFCETMQVACQVTQAKKRQSSSVSNESAREKKSRMGKRMRILMARQEDKLDNTTTASIREEKVFVTAPHNPTNLFGVDGLDRRELQQCVEAFFQRLGACMPLFHDADAFQQRLDAFLALHSGLPLPLHSGHIEPASELLVLAVAFRGSTDPSLQSQLERRFLELVEWRDTLYEAGLDAAEAIYLVSELNRWPLHPTQASCRFPTLFQHHVLSTRFAVELMLSLGLHQGPNLEQDNAVEFRRRFIFWSTFMLDALHSVSARTMYRIHDDDIGWLRRPPEMFYSGAMLELAMLARRICRELVSPRARSQGGVAAPLLATLLDDLEAWHERALVIFDKEAKAATSADEQRASDTRRCFALTTWLSFHLCVWASVSDLGIKEGGGDDDSVERRLAHVTREACRQMASIARHCVSQQLVDSAPTVLRHIPAAWALWCARIAVSRAATDRGLEELRQWAVDLVECVRSAKSLGDSEDLAASLQDILHRALSPYVGQAPTTSDIFNTVSTGVLPFIPQGPTTTTSRAANDVPAPTTNETLLFSNDTLDMLDRDMQAIWASLGFDVPHLSLNELV